MSTATTHIKTEKQLVPVLRFNEFEGQFHLKEFDEITDITRLAGYEYSKYWKEDEEQEIIALRGYNVGKGELVLRDLGYISNALSMQLIRSRLSIGDIVYPCVGSIGNAVVIEENDKFHIQQNIAKITCNEFASPYYLVQFLTSDYGMREVYRFNASGAQPNVLVGSLRKYRINIPSLPEQQKIASFLSAVDEKIQQLTRKKNLLEQYKKGLMQQLFSGQLRFKDENGNSYPDWEEKRLGEIADVTKLAGFEFTKHIVYRDEGKIIALRGLNIKNNTLDLNQVKYIDDSDFTKLSRSKLFVGDLMYTYVGTIGEVAIIEENDRFYLAPNVSRIRFNEGECLAKFAIQYFINPVFKEREVGKYISSSSQPALSMTNIRKFKILLPSNSEQQKIATYLLSIDTKIGALNNQITQTQTFKKGLLQQMFVAA